jgi:AcrR family transcriptional regulator
LSRQESAQKTKQKILTSALAIVGESGYESLTTNALVSRAEVAKGTLYHHFSNLDEVVYAMVEMIVEQSLDDVPVENFESIGQYLQAIGEYIVSDFTQDPRLMNAVFGFLPKGMKDPYFKEVAQNMLENACNRIAPAIKNFYCNRVTEQKIDNAIRMVDMFSAGFCIHFTILGEKERHQAIWRDFSLMLERYLEE